MSERCIGARIVCAMKERAGLLDYAGSARLPANIKTAALLSFFLSAPPCIPVVVEC